MRWRRDVVRWLVIQGEPGPTWLISWPLASGRQPSHGTVLRMEPVGHDRKHRLHGVRAISMGMDLLATTTNVCYAFLISSRRT